MDKIDHEQYVKLLVGWIKQQLPRNHRPEDSLLVKVAEQVIASTDGQDPSNANDWDLSRLVCEAIDQIEATDADQQQLRLVRVVISPDSPRIGGSYMDRNYVAKPGVPFVRIGERTYNTDGSVAASPA